ncbi:MAG: ASKHA domain-containing protein [Pseudomonadota bacterium]
MPSGENEKCLVIFQPSGCRGYIDRGKTLKQATVALGVDIEGVCGEQAICGTCKVRIEEGEFEKYGIRSGRESLSAMGPSERKFFNLRQVDEGYRLACQAQILDDVVVFVPEESRMGKQVVRKAPTTRPIEVNPVVKKYALELIKATLEDNLGDWERLTDALEKKYGLKNLTIDYEVLMELQGLVRQGEWKVTVSVWHGKEVIRVEPGIKEKGYGLAVDVGTSTVAGYLCDLSDGTVVATASMMNPQIVYGEDVMSRISYTMTNPDGLEILNQAIIDGLNNIAAEAAERAGIKRQDILDMTLVGNTCMHHIYMNINPRYIGRSPFAPSLHHSLDIKARDFGFKIPQEKEREEKGKYAPCRVECPAGVNVDDFLYLIAQRKFKDALELVRLSYPFAGVCGRVCTHPCEGICERGRVDDPISIRAAHRFLSDWELSSGREKATPVELKKASPIAIVGSGPAGLACAYDLIGRGHPVTVFEAQAQAGGMMRYGIPEYRLPKSILDDEIRYIEELGVEIKTKTPIKTPEELFAQEYKAVFLATGTWKSQKLNVPGEESPNVLYALDLLREINSGKKMGLTGRVAVIGGGSVAVDAARVAKRLGAREVHLICLESSDLTCKDRMPAQDLEIEQAREEGVIIHPSLGVSALVTENGQVKGVETVGCVSVYDPEGRFAPQFSDQSAPTMAVDTVIVAIGQRMDETLFPDLARTASGVLQVDEKTLETSLPGVFAGGDAASGPANVIKAIRAGKEAAISIELYLAGKDLKEDRPKPLKAVEEIPKEGIRKEARQKAAELAPDKRAGFDEVELGLEEDQVVPESIRCLHCAVFAQKEAMEEKEAHGWGIKISPGAYVHCLPIEAGFVGADNVGVLIAEAPYNQDSMELIIDIGTNGEIILGNRERLISASCATGPAFEGAQLRFGMRAAPGAIEKIAIDPETKEVRFKIIDEVRWNTEMKPEEVKAKGICGSGIIDAIPQLFLAGIIDKSGKFIKTVENPRLRFSGDQYEYVIAWAHETSIGQDVVVCQDDIRAIQLGKAAMYAGSKILMETLGIDKVDKVILAGAFGSYIDKLSAAVLGMFPDCDPKNVYSVGNAAGDGARMALLNVNKRREADEYARKVEYIELTISPKFEKIFAHSMWIPHMKDAFPNLQEFLPAKK